MTQSVRLTRLACLLAVCVVTGCDEPAPGVDAMVQIDAMPDANAPDSTVIAGDSGAVDDALPPIDDAAIDAVPPEIDAAPDATPPDADATPPETDATPPEIDAAPPEMDAARPELDAAPPELDAAPPELDAAPPEPDAAPPEPDAAPLEPDAALPQLDPPRITELMARGGAELLDEDGEAADWLELYNPNPVPYPLADHHLTDDPDDLERWTLPDVELPPLGYRVVFASGKDRIDPAGPLHTDFRLDAGGEYLAITDPDGVILDEWDTWPPQIDGVSYGRPMNIERVDLTPETVRYRGLDQARGPWIDIDYDDSDWALGPPALGYDRQAGGEGGEPEIGALLADSQADWSPLGEQGFRGWTMGYSDRGPAGGGVYFGDDFIPFPRDGGGHSATDAWNGSSYTWFRGNPPWTSVGQLAVHPNGVNNGVEHWAMRRWTSPVGGGAIIEWSVRKSNLNQTGVTGRVFHTSAEGTIELDVAPIDGNDGIGVTRQLFADLAPGDHLDFAVDPTGPEGQQQDFSDGSELWARIYTVADLGDLAQLDPGVDPGVGLAVRAHLDIPPGPAFDRIAATVYFDDALFAWIDAVPVAIADALDFDPAAPEIADRPIAAVLTPASILLPALPAGPHLLALNLLDAAADDGRLLLNVSVAGERLSLGDGEAYLDPTPGADNAPPREIGPIVFDLSRDVPATAGEPIEVLARVAATAAPIDTVQLTWRVRFGPAEVLDMVPDVDDPDLYRAVLPTDGLAQGELIRWAVDATDVDGRATREPPFLDPLDSEQYRGTVLDDPTIVTDLPVLHWFIERPDLANRESGTRSTMWFDGELYDNVLVDLHGQSTRGFPKKSYDVDLNRDHRFRLNDDVRRMKDFNLLTTYADKSRVRNTMSYELFARAGADHHLAFPIRIQQNGAFFSVHDFVEDGDDRWIERLGYDPVGALYKVYDGVVQVNRGEKKTRKDEPNDDYAALIAGVRLAGEERRIFLRDNLDLARMANYLAASFIYGGVDCCHKNFYLYRDTDGSARWWMLPWDVDLSLGRVWTGSYFDDRMYPETGLFIGRDTGARNLLLEALYQDPLFVQMYLRRVRTLVDTLLQAPDTPPADRLIERRVEEISARIGADAQLDADSWPTWGAAQTMAEGVGFLLNDWLQPRREWVYGTLVEHDPGVVLIPGDPGAATARYRVPIEDDPMLAWIDPDFDDDAWPEGPLGLGYENAPADYSALIRTEVRPTDSAPTASSIQLRVPFVVEDPAVERLALSVKYDDGYVAWLNGVEIARRNVDGLPAWDAVAALHDDRQAVSFETIDVTEFAELLRPGLNVLAMQVVNNGAGSSDLLIQPALVDGFIGSGVLPPAQRPDAHVVAEALVAEENPAHSYIVLHNPGPQAVDVSDWTLRGAGVEHRFTPGTVIPSDARFHVAPSERSFKGRPESPFGGEGHLVQGGWRGQLVPELGPIEFLDANGERVIIPE